MLASLDCGTDGYEMKIKYWIKVPMRQPGVGEAEGCDYSHGMKGGYMGSPGNAYQHFAIFPWLRYESRLSTLETLDFEVRSINYPIYKEGRDSFEADQSGYLRSSMMDIIPW